MFFFLHAGFIARDSSKGMGVENSTYTTHEMEYVLQRFDQVRGGGGITLWRDVRSCIVNMINKGFFSTS